MDLFSFIQDPNSVVLSDSGIPWSPWDFYREFHEVKILIFIILNLMLGYYLFLLPHSLMNMWNIYLLNCPTRAHLYNHRAHMACDILTHWMQKQMWESKSLLPSQTANTSSTCKTMPSFLPISSILKNIGISHNFMLLTCNLGFVIAIFN